MTGDPTEENCVRLRGLPWSAKDQDIRNFFKGVPGTIVSIHFTYTREGRPSGEAYCEFDSADTANAALEKDNATMGKRYIEVFIAKRSEMTYMLKHRGQPIGTEDAIVRLRGLPFQCTKEDLSDFFSGLDIVANGILLPVDMAGRSTGEAFVQFADPSTAERAMERHMDKIGHRYVEVFRSSQEEVKTSMWRLTSGAAGGDAGPAGYGPGGRGAGGSFGGGGMGGMGGMGMQMQGMGGMGRAAGMGMGGYGSGMGMGGMGMGGGMGGGMNFGGGQSGGGGMGGMGGGGGIGGMNSTGGMGGMGGMMGGGGGYGATPMALAHLGGGGGGMMMNKFGMGGGGGYGGKKPGAGHFVSMRGLPFRCTEKDIRDFFSPLQIANISFTSDFSGRPSGEADVEFFSHNDAVEAMKRDRDNIGTRYVELFLNSTAVGKGGGMAFGGPLRTMF